MAIMRVGLRNVAYVADENPRLSFEVMINGRSAGLGDMWILDECTVGGIGKWLDKCPNTVERLAKEELSKLRHVGQPTYYVATADGTIIVSGTRDDCENYCLHDLDGLDAADDISAAFAHADADHGKLISMNCDLNLCRLP